MFTVVLHRRFVFYRITYLIKVKERIRYEKNQREKTSLPVKTNRSSWSQTLLDWFNKFLYLVVGIWQPCFRGKKIMTVAETSIQTLHELKKTNELTHQEGEVLESLLEIDYFPTRNELKQEVMQDWEKSTISGRVNGLIEKGFVEELPKRSDKFNGRKAKVLMPLEDKIKKEVL